MAQLRILAIPGSLRATSYNRALLDAAAANAPPGVQVVLADLRGVPVFDQDREDSDNGGEKVSELRAAVAAADALLFATPECNQSLPALKNAVDWLSRAAPQRVLQDKPVAVTGVSSGPWGTRYAQQMLRHTLAATGCLVLTSPLLFVREADSVFEGGRLVDDTVRDQLAELVAALAAWARMVAPTAVVAS